MVSYTVFSTVNQLTPDKTEVRKVHHQCPIYLVVGGNVSKNGK